MSTGLAYRHYDKGGMCYAACQEAFEWYPYSCTQFQWYLFKSILGGMLQPFGAKKDATFQEEECQTNISGIIILLLMINFNREEAENMCKMMAASTYHI